MSNAYDHGETRESSETTPAEGDRLIDIRQLLEGLEHFRWFVIKSAAAVMIGMVICLVGGNEVVEVLRRPLHQVQVSLASAGGPVVPLQESSNQVRGWR